MRLKGWDPGIGFRYRNGVLYQQGMGLGLNLANLKGVEGFWGKEIFKIFMQSGLLGIWFAIYGDSIGKSRWAKGIFFVYTAIAESVRVLSRFGRFGIRKLSGDWISGIYGLHNNYWGGIELKQNLFSILVNNFCPNWSVVVSSQIFSFRAVLLGDLIWGEIASIMIDVIRYGIGSDSILGEDKETWVRYIRDIVLSFLFIDLITFLALKITTTKGFNFLWNNMSQGQLLGNMGDMRNGEGTRKRLKISVPHFDNSALIKSCSKVLLGRCMNPPKQEMKALLSNLPKIWNMVDQVTGKDLGLGRFQFDFEREEDIEGVLRLQPYHFDYWMISVAKWQPKRALNFPSEIPFWVRVLGISTEYRTVATFESIGEAIGRLIEVDLEQMRVLVVVDAFKELCFETSIEFKGGEFYEGIEVAISLRYEKLFGYCELCGSLCHEESKCPLAKTWNGKRETRNGSGGWHEGGKHDERARSFKGVVMNGNGNPQHRERDGKDHYGRGKGKVIEETDSKWVKIGDRGHKSASGNRGAHGGGHGGGGESSRYRSNNKEATRSSGQGGRVSNGTGDAGTQVEHQRQTEDSREEGEIMVVEEVPPSREFQEQLLQTQADGSVMVANTDDMEVGLQKVQDLVKGKTHAGGDEEMEWDALNQQCLEDDLDMEGADDLPDLTPEEEMALNQALGEAEDLAANEERSDTREGNDQAAGEELKKQVTKKRHYKPPPSVAVSNKLRAANALVSTNKRAPAKPGIRIGDGKSQQENKGPSNPQASYQKP